MAEGMAQMIERIHIDTAIHNVTLVARRPPPAKKYLFYFYLFLYQRT